MQNVSYMLSMSRSQKAPEHDLNYLNLYCVDERMSYDLRVRIVIFQCSSLFIVYTLIFKVLKGSSLRCHRLEEPFLFLSFLPYNLKYNLIFFKQKGYSDVKGSLYRPFRPKMFFCGIVKYL